LAPDVNAITGRPSAMKTSDFTICATSQPIAFAASWAVFVPSGNRRTRGSSPSPRADSMNRSIALIVVAGAVQPSFRAPRAAWRVLYDSAP
jgi:hypothetical protein